MTIDKLDYEWADTGDTTEPSDAKKQAGWAGGDRPSIEYLNWVENRQDDKIQRLITERVDSFYGDSTDAQKMIMTGLWDDNWDDNDYVYSGVATTEYVDTAVYFTSTNEPRLLALDLATNKIHVFNPRTMALLETSGDLTDDLKSGKTYYANSMCTDGTYVYCTLGNNNDSTVDVQCWQISDWSVRTGWPATGTNMTGTSTINATQKLNDIIIADDDYIAVVRLGKTVVAAGTEVVSTFLRTTGAIGTEGAGDCPTGAGAAVMPSICSDGTNLYFCSYDATPDSYLCSAAISNVATGGGGANYPLTVSNSVCACVCAVGTKIVSTYWINAGQAKTDTVFLTHTASDADLDVIISGDSCHSTPITQQEYCGFIYSMCYDGVNLWLSCRGDNSGADSTHNLVKIDAQKLMVRAVDAGEERSFFDIVTGSYNIADGMVFAATSEDHGIQCVFDGRDVWTITDSTASAATSGRLYRLPLALLRS